MDTGTGNKRHLIDIHGIAKSLGLEMCKALPAFHSFPGSDCTSSFVMKGKVKPMKLLQKHQLFTNVFQRLGSTLDSLNDKDLQDLQHFVCCMYGNPKCIETNKLRYDIFKSRYDSKSTIDSCFINNGIDLSLLPPCHSSLCMHYLRVNYQTFIWRNSHEAMVDVPTPVGNG